MKALEIFERRLGVNHPNSVTTRKNLKIIRAALGCEGKNLLSSNFKVLIPNVTVLIIQARKRSPYKLNFAGSSSDARRGIEKVCHMNEKLQAILTELQSCFKGLYGERLVQMVLYGSQARKDAEPGSDIDVLVILKGPVNPGDEIERTGETVADLSVTLLRFRCRGKRRLPKSFALRTSIKVLQLFPSTAVYSQVRVLPDLNNTSVRPYLCTVRVLPTHRTVRNTYYWMERPTLSFQGSVY